MEERTGEASTKLIGSEMMMLVYASPERVNLEEEQSYEGWHTHAWYLYE